MKIISVANQKGGVGKTTTTVNLSVCFAKKGYKVLLVDLDPQGNASTGLGVRRSLIRNSVYDVLFEAVGITEAAVKTKVPGLSVVPSSVHLSGAEIELVTAENREFRLRDALRRPLPYDYVIIDCPPSLNLLTVNAMVAAHSVLVPLQSEFFALEGLSQLLQTVERIRARFNRQLSVMGVVLTMYDRRNKLTEQVSDDVRACLGDVVFETVIPRNVRLSEAPSHGLPALIYDHRCTGSEAYIDLARELIGRLPDRKVAA